ncbi:sensor histidine kinase [Streptomyces sp. YGL11-2]|uniref:sensor histidine kinase n=1 Tax=Streptomyces sp. YGL11-2 TaxID=3414028 RepID=UPI003CE8B255
MKSVERVDARAWAGALWRRLAEPGQWSRRRVAGECVLAVVLALLAAGMEALGGHGGLRMALVAAAVATASLLRRALPEAMLIVAGALGGGTDGGDLLLTVVAWSAGRRIDGVLRATVSLCASFAVYEALDLWPWSEAAPGGAVFTAVVFLVLAVVPGLASRYWAQRRTLLRTLQERNLQLLRERQMIAGQARMRERQRIAQDMHDSLGHQLALITVHTGALEVDQELTGRQREAVGVLREASVAAMHELRAVVGILSDGTPEDAKPAAKGVAGIRSLVESAAAAGTPVVLEESGEPRPLAPTADHAGYRVAQEGLTNAYKHAPGAPITVSLRYEPDSLVVEVGNGPVPQAGAGHRAAVSGGQGLTGLGERARLVGGMLYAGKTADGGFRLAGVFPYGAGNGHGPGDAHGSGNARTTSDGAVDDFWRQNGEGPLGEGEPVIDQLDPREELKSIMSAKKRSNGCLIIGGTALLMLVGLVAAGLFGVGTVVREAEKGAIDPQVYAGVKVGEPEAQVRHTLPSGSSFLMSGTRSKLPAEPAGSTCQLFLSTADEDDPAADTVYRFCFKDGKLADKREFHVKS